jgi:hypothetical protein
MSYEEGSFVLKDKVLPKSIVDIMETVVMADKFPWHFLFDSAVGNSKNAHKTYSFFHNILMDRQPVSPYFDVFHLGALQIMEKFDIDISERRPFRIRLAMQTSYGEPVVNEPHIDAPIPHQAIVYYFNDSEGDTFFYNKDKSVYKEISPKRNRAVLFDGLIEHSSSKPVNNPVRIIMNIDICGMNEQIGQFKQ